MDRRLFFRTVFSSSLAIPLVAGLKPGAGTSGGELFLISDSPQDVLPPLLRGLAGEGRLTPGLFSLGDSQPLAEAVGTALAKDGWRRSAPGQKPGLVLSFSPLRQACAPSFTFVRDGRVVDIRHGGLQALWREISKPGARSSCLTIASLKAPAATGRGQSAILYLDGRKKDRLDLGRETAKTYETAGGFVRVAVEGGSVRVSESSCRHKICASSAAVSGTGDRIVCAPNRFLVQVEGRRAVDTVIG